jgi:hypothetical protein
MEEGSEKQKRHYHHSRLPKINPSIMTCMQRGTPSFAKPSPGKEKLICGRATWMDWTRSPLQS